MISRRRFTQAVAATGAAGVAGSALTASAAGTTARTPGADLRAGAGQHTSLGPIKRVKAGVLETAYAEFGPRTGQPVVLLHGWPYDAHSYVDVAPILAAAGYRVIVPFLRGYGQTRFRSSRTFRNGQQSAVALDIIALMDALEIDQAVLGGFDWGARTVGVIAALWPERCKAIVSVSSYLVTSLEKNLEPLPPAAELGWWYQYYFATERGVKGYQQNWYAFNDLIWKIASPLWRYDAATYARTAAAFDNPDHVAIVIHNYRWRLSLAEGERQYDRYERKLAAGPVITVPAITIGSDFDGAAADGSGYRNKFTGKYAHRVFEGIGHNVPQEAPQAFAQAVIDADHL
ncbi:alpha/beta hydrolase [Kribbella sp. ALI-6-A]|uniref:alpha/beta fold hydrolase n=1 Tax=Kribbella sp. ALI-6-A TaxID=1933817 RepID=UPI00097C1A87|nr:alpha/beta hydrolase [Kribbella sp. ALI-6-A]ONI74596.1 alpha/beta hydrolase [Kribbella sp. ALI-6-A]